jgi:hypothetical protein
MRPVLRGACPQDEHGQEVRFSEYTHARRDLIGRLGEYCSYCEMQLDASLAVEHVQPKKPPGAKAALPERELAWGNFLLACTNCNSTKWNTDVVLGDYLWPDRDNTFHSLSYSEGGRIDSATGPQKAQADRLIALVGLQKAPDTVEASDRRWLNRREAWDMAVRAKERLARCPGDDMKEQIIETVQAKGFWSIWMTVFKNDADMQARLIAALPGTRTEYFEP